MLDRTYSFQGQTYGPSTPASEVPDRVAQKNRYDRHKAAEAKAGRKAMSFRDFKDAEADGAAPEAPADDSGQTEDEQIDTELPESIPHRKLLSQNGIKTLAALRATDSHEDLEDIGDGRWDDIQEALAKLD